MSESKVVHCKRDPYDVYVGRGSEWGNPYSHKSGTKAEHVVASRDEAIECYRRHLWARIAAEEGVVWRLAALHGKTLGCWCAPKRCHAEVLVRAAAYAVERINR